MVGNWNEWFTGILYMSDTKNYPLASFLQVIVVQGNQQDLSMDPTSAAAMSERTIKAAQVFIGALPILLVYPALKWVQLKNRKYRVSKSKPLLCKHEKAYDFLTLALQIIKN